MKTSAEYWREARERQRAARDHRALHPPVPPGWTHAAWTLYLSDPDGGRAPMRAERLPYPPDTTPSVAEVLSWEADR